MTIPSKVEQLQDDWCSHTLHLTNVILSSENNKKNYFEKDSEIQTIEKCAFEKSNLSSLEFPDSLVDLQEGWCFGAESLYDMIISPKNQRFSFIDNKMVVKKKDINGECYDTLVFVSRYVETLKIPSFIKYIDCYAFSSMISLSEIDFTEDSQLEMISKYAFCLNIIEKLHIPEKVTYLEDGWCLGAICLSDISISPKNKNFKFLDNQKNIIVGKPNPEINVFDLIIFASREIKEAFIPSYIMKISSAAFSDCSDLILIDFPEYSELQSIGESCFSGTSIQKMVIPRKVTQISDDLLCNCVFLHSLEILGILKCN